MSRPLAIIYKRGRELSPAVRKFIDVLTTSKVKVPGGHPARGNNDKGDHSERAETAERLEKVEKSA